jgi:excisionase family DNA binding protein
MMVVEPEPHRNSPTENIVALRNAVALRREVVQMLHDPSQPSQNSRKLSHMDARSKSPLGLSTSQAAQALGVSLGTIRRWSDMGYLESYRTPGGQRRFSAEQIDQFLVTFQRGGDPGQRRDRMAS